MKALMRTRCWDGDLVEVVDVVSGPYMMALRGGAYWAVPPEGADNALDVFSVTREDGTPWLIPASMVQFIE